MTQRSSADMDGRSGVRRHALDGTGAGRSWRWSLLWVLAAILTGCPSQETISANPDSGPGTSDVPDTAVEDIPVTPDSADTGEPLALTCGTSPEQSGPFPGEGLGVRITNPTSGGGVLYSSATLALGGIAFGTIDTMTWSLGDASGSITPGAFWQAQGVPLQPGDNRVTVTATGPGGTATDDVLVHLHASPISGVRLRVSPDHVYVGEPRSIRVAFSVELGEFDPDTVKLVRVDTNGVPTIDPALPLHDAGDANECDDVAGDGVFGACLPVTASSAGRRCYRASMTTTAGEALSQQVCFDAIERVSVPSCLVAQQAVTNAESAYASAGDHALGIAAARQALSDAGAVTVGEAAEQLGVWARFDSGVLVAIPLGVPEGYRGTPVDSRNVLLLRGSGAASEIDIAPEAFRPDTCPPFSPKGPWTGNEATLSRFRQLADGGIFAFSGHGGAFFGGLADQLGWHHPGQQEVFFTGQAVQCAALQEHAVSCDTDADCPGQTRCVAVGGTDGSGECIDETQADLARGRVVLGPGVYGITPGFVSSYGRSGLPRTLVYAGSCHSAWSGAMAMAFLGVGAGAYVGYSGMVRDEWATAVGTRLFERLATDQVTVDEALCHGSDPESPGTSTRLIGSKVLSGEVSGLFNAGFETAGALGWTRSGDARQVTNFCGERLSQSSRFMGLLSTGLGTSVLNGTSGSFEQTFCIPASVTTLTFWWRFYSAELESFCGTGGFQDRWRVSLTRAGSTTPVDVKHCSLDDMCYYDVAACQPQPCSAGSSCGCGDCYEPYFDVTKCTFDGQPVKATDFVQETFNVSGLAGVGPVTLRISIDDKGDGVNDSAILIDDIKFQ